MRRPRSSAIWLTGFLAIQIDPMQILVTGSSGQVGLALAKELSPLATLRLTNRQDLDLSKPHSVPERLEEIKPDLIINAAAYTAVDKAESEPDIAYAVNGTAVGVLGEWAARNDVPLIHFSTDYVFDGQATEPYDESHSVNPLSIYGKSKTEGERLLLRSGAPCLIVRTAWVYSATGKNFLKTIVRLAAERDELAVVSDQIGTPTSAGQIAKFIHFLVGEKREALPTRFEKSSHIVHVTASGWTSWHGFASAIVAGMRRYGIAVKASAVRAIPASDYPTPAVRPKFSRLSTTRLGRVFGFHPEPWEQSLDGVLKVLLSKQ
jgi:dTDP-4-dehydrorhamnose reductase